MNGQFRLMCAPLQGLTDSAFRHFHSMLTADGATEYFTPFLRVEHGEVRRRDVAELSSVLNEGTNLTPQIIFRSPDEFSQLVETVIAAGHNRINLNLGCPFPPQVKKGRGAGLLIRPELLGDIAGRIRAYGSAITFSIKMRLGVDRPDSWRDVVDIINDMPLDHVTIHPRTATQQYTGELHLDEFEMLAKALKHQVIFNGEIHTPDDITSLRERYPELAGVMVGRGLLSRPTLFAEYLNSEPLTADDCRDIALKLHANLIAHYGATLCGDTQILSHLTPWHDYLVDYLDRKTLKLLHKARTLAAYRDAFPSRIQ